MEGQLLLRRRSAERSMERGSWPLSFDERARRRQRPEQTEGSSPQEKQPVKAGRYAFSCLLSRLSKTAPSDSTTMRIRLAMVSAGWSGFFSPPASPLGRFRDAAPRDRFLAMPLSPDRLSRIFTLLTRPLP